MTSTTATLDEEGQTNLEGGRGYSHAIRLPVAMASLAISCATPLTHLPNTAIHVLVADGMLLRGLRKPLSSFWLLRWDTLVFIQVKGL